MENANILFDVIRAFMSFLCKVIYPLIIDLWDLFYALSKTRLFDTDSGIVSVIYSRVGLLLGIIMLFRVIFSLIQMLVNPDVMTDKQKGASSLIQKVIVVVLALALIPTAFDKAFELQEVIIEENVIGKVVLGSNSSTEGFGEELAANLFLSFYTPNELVPKAEFDNECSSYNFIASEMVSFHTMDLIDQCLYETTDVKSLTDYNENIRVYYVDFAGNGFFAAAVGAAILWMILMYCIYLGARIIQLAFLQIVAPIPVIGHLMLDKDSSLVKWAKLCLSTYLDLFIRVAIIDFVVLVISYLINSDGMAIIEASSGATGTTLTFVYIAIILGLLLFAKKVPDLLGEIFPSLGGGKGKLGFGVSWKKMTGDMLGGKLINTGLKKVGGFAAAAPGVLASTAARAYNAHRYNARENEKLDSYRQRRLEQLRSARDNVLANTTLSAAQKDLALKGGIGADGKRHVGLDKQIANLERRSRRSLRSDLSRANNRIASAMNNIKDTDPNAAEKRAKAMEAISTNRASGMGQRNQAATFAGSIAGGTLRAANAAIHGKSVGDIAKKANESQIRAIMDEQGWYRTGAYGLSNVIQRTVSQVQRKFGIETAGQAQQFIIDNLESDIKNQEEVVNKAKEVEQSYSSGKASTKAVETEGSSDLNKNKTIKYYDPSTSSWKEFTLSTRTGEMKNAAERVKEYYTGMGTSAGMKTLTTGSAPYKVLENFINIVSRNSSADPTAQTQVKTDLMNALSSSSNVDQAFNTVLTMANQKISKSESDYGKEQGAAGLLYHLMGSTDPNVQAQLNAAGAYSNQTIINEYESIRRDIISNPNRYGPDMITLINNIEAYRSTPIADFNETTMVNLMGAWGKLKDAFDVAQADQSRVVADANDELQAMRHESSAFKNYVVTNDALEADKFGGGHK